MTKNFSNQRRDDMHPSSRNSASGNFREEQPSRPARQRLSRDAVDRAWENGATRTYADYHPRKNPPTSYDRSRQPQNRRPYEASQESYGAARSYPRQRPDNNQRHFGQPGARTPGNPNTRWTRDDTSHAPERYGDQRPAHFRQHGSEADQRGYNRPARVSQPGPNTFHGTQQRPPRFQQESDHEFRGDRSPRFQREGGNAFRDNRPARFPQEHNSEFRGDRSPRFQREGGNEFRGNRPARFPQDASQGPQRSRPFERSNQGPREGTQGGRRDNFNPRWQSRPGQQQDYPNQARTDPMQRNNFADQRPGRAQFEGDYEHYNDFNPPRESHYPAQPAYEPPPYEQQVTRLPDGRVLKGSRPSQRKQAHFWNGVEEQTAGLLSQSTPAEERAVPETTKPEAAPERAATRASRPGIRKAGKVKTARAEEPKTHTAKVARKNARAPQRPVTRPSRRGYKWPAPGENSGNND